MILNQKLKYILCSIIIIVSFFSMYHNIHHMAGLKTNCIFFTPIIIFFIYMYVDKFLMEQLGQVTKKLFVGLFLLSILFAWEYQDRHSHYIFDILLYFLTGFAILMWLFTIKKISFTAKVQTLSDVYDFKDNGFDFIRFVLASLVFITHAGVILHLFNINLINIFFSGGTPGSVALYCFFAISGFFMVQSLDNSKTSYAFIMKRVLRIFPLLFIVIIIGSIFYGDGLFHENSLKNLRGQLFLGAFNGSISIGHFSFGTSWSLKLEFLSYIILLILYTISNRNKKLILIVSMLFISVDLVLYLHNGKIATPFHDHTLMYTLHNNVNYAFFGFFPCFMIGSLMYLYKDRIICNKHMVLCGIFAYLFIVLIIGRTSPTAFTICQIFIIPYLIITCGSLLKVQLWTKYGDFSYGIYLINEPLLFLPQLQHICKNSAMQGIVIYALTLFLAILSWYIIEKQALKFKRYL